MSKEGDRASVFRTTKVRNKLKGDCSWMQRSVDVQSETSEEKPWMAEVRANRLSSALEPSPVVSPTPATAPVDKPKLEKARSSGYLIRGVFTKTECKPASTSTSNGFRASPTVVRPAPELQRAGPPVQSEGQLSLEEKERRTEAASNVLKKSSVRQRSYVLSAAKKFESAENELDTSLNSSPSFVAKRVEITDEDESAEPIATKHPTIPAHLPAPVPEPTLQTLVKMSVNTVEVKADEPVAPEPVAPVKEATATVVSIKEDTLVVVASATAEDDDGPFKDMKPGCTKVATPLPMLILEPEEVEAPSQDLKLSEIKDACPVVPVESTPPPVAETPVLEESAVWEAPAPAITGDTVKKEPVEEPSQNQTSASADTLTTLSATLISFDTSSTSLLDTEIEDVVPEPTSQVAESVEQEPVPEISNCIVLTDDLLSLTEGPEEELVEPVPPSPGRWSQDLLGGPESLSGPVNNSLDLLADDVIPINTEVHRLSTDTKENNESTDVQSPTDTFTTRTADISNTETYPASRGSQVTTPAVSTSSSTDPFDPYPIGTISPNSSSDPMPPLSAHSINSFVDLMSNTSPAEGDLNSGIGESTNALEALAEDVIPIDTDTKSLSSRRSWARTWETDTSTDERQEDVPANRGEDQQTLVMFERKSLENDSPWDRWTSPTVFAVTSTTEEEESPGEMETQTVTTVTTVTTNRESDPEPAMDRTVTSEDSPCTETPEPKKPFVYVREYVNVTELSSHNARDDLGSGSEYLTSSSTSYPYSLPTTYSRKESSSTCNYCGEVVGNDAKITIEHLNINCHPTCFKCGVCSKPMGDLVYSMFLHNGTVYCESCYSNASD